MERQIRIIHDLSQGESLHEKKDVRKFTRFSLQLNNHNGRGPYSPSSGFGNNGDASSCSASLRQKKKLTKPPMVRHSSDLLWRVSTLGSGSNPSSRMESRFCQEDRSPSRHSLTVPDSSNSRGIININEQPDTTSVVVNHQSKHNSSP